MNVLGNIWVVSGQELFSQSQSSWIKIESESQLHSTVKKFFELARTENTLFLVLLHFHLPSIFKGKINTETSQ